MGLSSLQGQSDSPPDMYLDVRSKWVGEPDYADCKDRRNPRITEAGTELGAERVWITPALVDCPTQLFSIWIFIGVPSQN